VPVNGNSGSAGASAARPRTGMWRRPSPRKEVPHRITGWPSDGGGANIRAALSLSRAKDFRPRGDASGDALIQLVRAMITRDPGLPFSVANISRAARITPNYLSMLFTKYAGQSFVAFLNERRIDLAKKHLQDLRLSITEVADMSGFSDASYFGRRFRQATGKTPEGWRQGVQ